MGFLFNYCAPLLQHAGSAEWRVSLQVPGMGARAGRGIWGP